MTENRKVVKENTFYTLNNKGVFMQNLKYLSG